MAGAQVNKNKRDRYSRVRWLSDTPASGITNEKLKHFLAYR